MSLAAELIKEFLIGIKFAIDEAGQQKAQAAVKAVEKTTVESDKRTLDAEKRSHRDRQEMMARAGRNAEQFARTVAQSVAAIATVAATTTFAVQRLAAGLESLSYASKRSNSSADNLKAIGFAAGQLGSTAESAIGSVTALAKRLKESPGYESLLRGLGVSTRDGKGGPREAADMFLDLGDALRKMPRFQAKAYGDALGISDHDLEALLSGKLKKGVEEYKGMLAQAGVSMDQAGKTSSRFMDTWRKAWAAVEIVAVKAGGALMERFGPQIDRFAAFLLQNADGISRGAVRFGESILRIVDRVGELADKFSKLDPQTRAFIVQIGALGAALAIFAAGPLGIIAAIAAGIVVLYDDYRKWQEGSKDTLIPWDKWAPKIEAAIEAIKNLAHWVSEATKAIGLEGGDGLTAAFVALGLVLGSKVLKPLTAIVGLLGAAGLMKLLGGLGLIQIAGGGGHVTGADHADRMKNDPGYRADQEGLTAGAQGGWIGRAFKGVKNFLGIGGGGSTERANPTRSPANLENGAKEAYSFWKSKGLSHEQAAGLVGMEQGESSFNPGARGDGGLAHGLFQHHPDRRAKILAATGIDISTANANQQREAAWWELNNTEKGALAAIRAAKNPSEAAAAGVKYFERPADVAGESRLRAGYAEGWAQKFAAPAASGAPAAGTYNFDRSRFYDGLKWLYRGPDGGYYVNPPSGTAGGASTGVQVPRKWLDGAEKGVAAASRIDQTFGAGGAAGSFSRVPLGGWGSPSTTNNKTISIGPTTSNVTVSGVGDAKEVGDVVGRTQSRVHADLLRNLQGAVG